CLLLRFHLPPLVLQINALEHDMSSVTRPISTTPVPLFRRGKARAIGGRRDALRGTGPGTSCPTPSPGGARSLAGAGRGGASVEQPIPERREFVRCWPLRAAHRGDEPGAGGVEEVETVGPQERRP